MQAVINRVDERARQGVAVTQVWPTGMGILDDVLDGGFRSGNLVLLAGPQGQGKTTLAMQMARNVALSGRPVVYFCFEHEPEVLLERLIAMEAAVLSQDIGGNQRRIREAFEATAPTEGGLLDRLQHAKSGQDALLKVQEYHHMLHVHRSTGTSTTVGVISSAIDDVRRDTGANPLVIVDYLQKVRVHDGPSAEEDRVTIVAEDLKDLAIEHEVPVVAISAADKAGLTSGKRMRAQNLRGSTALAYEADVLLILNNKYDIVSRQALLYAVDGADRFKAYAVLSVEKNRHGQAGVDLEYRKHFDQYRFDPAGHRVVEQLIDGRLVLD